MERSLLNLMKTPETTSCCPRLCTFETQKKRNKNFNHLRDDEDITICFFSSLLSVSRSLLSLPLLGAIIKRISSGWAPRSYGPPYNMGFHDCP